MLVLARRRTGRGDNLRFRDSFRLGGLQQVGARLAVGDTLPLAARFLGQRLAAFAAEGDRIGVD
jgi:hypothetical protein